MKKMIDKGQALLLAVKTVFAAGYGPSIDVWWTSEKRQETLWVDGAAIPEGWNVMLGNMVWIWLDRPEHGPAKVVCLCLMPKSPIAGCRWRHYKGQIYRVLGYCIHSETLAPMVRYQREGGAGPVWVRDWFDWDTLCHLPETGEMVPRFTRVNGDSDE